MLVALRCAHDDTPFQSESSQRKFLAQWLTQARRVTTFSGLAREFSSLRELLAKDKHMPIEGVLSALWEQSVLSDQCDFIRLRDAKMRCIAITGAAACAVSRRNHPRSHEQGKNATQPLFAANAYRRVISGHGADERAADVPARTQ